MILKTREYQQVLEMYAKEVLHEISDMGGSLCEEEPHLYSVADLEECPRRRWITITDVIKNKYLEEYYHSIVDPSKDKERAVEEVCAHMIHLVLGGVVSSYMLSGRVWEVCPRNILLRTHVLGGFDRYGAEHARVRVLGDDPYVSKRRPFHVIPSEQDMADWTMLQAQESLVPIMRELSRLSRYTESQCWGPLRGLINSYAKLVMHRYPRKRDQVERRMRYVYESCERLGLPLSRRIGRL